MLRQSSSKKGSHVVWDEENLKVNAEIQKEYSGIKVDEPKTPYHRPLSADDEYQEYDEDMKPLELDRGAPTAEDDQATARTAVMTAFEYVMSNGGAEFSPPEPPQHRLMTSSSDAADGGVERGGSFTSDDGCEASSHKKRRFAEMRKQHYNMKEALKQGRQLLASEDGEDEEEDSGSPARRSPAAGTAAPGEASSGLEAGGPVQQCGSGSQHQVGLAATEQQQQQQQQDSPGDAQDMDGS